MEIGGTPIPDLPVESATAFILTGEHRMGEFVSPDTASLPRFRDTPVIDSIDLSRPQLEEAIGVFDADETYGEEAMRCFFPRHGVRFRDGQRTIDVHICLECLWVYFWEGEERVFRELSPTGVKRIGQFFDSVFPQYSGMTNRAVFDLVRGKRSNQPVETTETAARPPRLT